MPSNCGSCIRILGIGLSEQAFQSQGRQHLFEINKTRYSGHADSGRSPNLIRRQRPGLFRAKGTSTSLRGRPRYWCREYTTATLILNNVFNFQSGSHNSCFLTIFANGSWGRSVALGPVQRLLCPVSTFRGLRHETCKAVLWGGSSGSILKWLFFFFFLDPGDTCHFKFGGRSQKNNSQSL